MHHAKAAPAAHCTSAPDCARLKTVVARLWRSRQFYLALVLLAKSRWKGGAYDVIFVDAISASIPILRLTGAKVRGCPAANQRGFH